MQNSAIEDESESELGSVFRANKSNSEKQQSINFMELAKLHLKQYDDIQQDQFQFVEQNSGQNTNRNNVNSNYMNMNMNMNMNCIASSSLSCSQNYLKLHSTFMPIGTNFQTQIPDIQSAQSYLKKNQQMIKRVQRLRVHSPKSNQQFYQNHKKMIYNCFGGNRTYQQIAWIKKCMQQSHSHCHVNGNGNQNQSKRKSKLQFEAYLKDQKIYRFWDQHFKSKDMQALRKLKKKKKKNKGSMDQ